MAAEVSEKALESMEASGMPMIKPGADGKMDMEQVRAAQAQSQNDPKEISHGMQQGMIAIKDMRSDADVPKRLEITEACKAEANKELASGSTAKALKNYLIGIWLLMRGDPEPTRALVAPKAVERDAKIALGAGAEGVTDEESFGESFVVQVREMRTALHLNVAAAALKLNMFALAGDACKVVLADRSEHPKALFRLARASEGTGDLAIAIATLGKLLKVDGQSDNADARKLLQALRSRKTKEAKIYGGFFDRARDDGGSLYNNPQAEKAERDLLNTFGDQTDKQKLVEEIINTRMIRLPIVAQKELQKMSKVGIAPSEILNAYRRFLITELKKMAHESVPEELSEIMGVMQAPEAKMEAMIDKVKLRIKDREREAASVTCLMHGCNYPPSGKSKFCSPQCMMAAMEAEKNATQMMQQPTASAPEKKGVRVEEIGAAEHKSTKKAAADKAAAEKAAVEKAVKAEKAAMEKITAEARWVAEKMNAEAVAAEKAAAEKMAAEEKVRAAKAAADKAAAEKVYEAQKRAAYAISEASKAAAEKEAAEKAAAEIKESADKAIAEIAAVEKRAEQKADIGGLKKGFFDQPKKRKPAAAAKPTAAAVAPEIPAATTSEQLQRLLAEAKCSKAAPSEVVADAAPASTTTQPAAALAAESIVESSERSRLYVEGEIARSNQGGLLGRLASSICCR